MFISPVNNTGEKFIGGVVDTGDRFFAVSLTPAINFMMLLHNVKQHNMNIT
jgi:hypothetical protein